MHPLGEGGRKAARLPLSLPLVMLYVNSKETWSFAKYPSSGTSTSLIAFARIGIPTWPVVTSDSILPDEPATHSVCPEALKLEHSKVVCDVINLTVSNYTL